MDTAVPSSTLAARAWPDGGPARVPNWAYTDPAIFQREMQRIFGANDWLYVCLEAELPNPGDFKRAQLGNREVIAVRGPDYAINVLVNRCAHRSMQVCTASHGSASGSSIPSRRTEASLCHCRLELPMPSRMDPATRWS